MCERHLSAPMQDDEDVPMTRKEKLAMWRARRLAAKAAEEEAADAERQVGAKRRSLPREKPLRPSKSRQPHQSWQQAKCIPKLAQQAHVLGKSPVECPFNCKAWVLQ